MSQRGSGILLGLIAAVLALVTCYFAYTLWTMESGADGVRAASSQALQAHSRKIELLNLRVDISRMNAIALSGSIIGVDAVRAKLSEFGPTIHRKFGAITAGAAGDPEVATRLNEFEPHLEALISALNQAPSSDNIERWRPLADEVDLKLGELAAADDTLSERKAAEFDAALKREAGLMAQVRTLGLALAGCAIFMLGLFGVAAVRLSQNRPQPMADPVSDLESASFNTESRSLARSDPELARYREEFISSFPARLRELESAVRADPKGLVDPARILAEAAETHGLEALSAVAHAFEVAAKESRGPAELKELLAAVRSECDQLMKKR